MRNALKSLAVVAATLGVVLAGAGAASAAPALPNLPHLPPVPSLTSGPPVSCVTPALKDPSGTLTATLHNPGAAASKTINCVTGNG